MINVEPGSKSDDVNTLAVSYPTISFLQPHDAASVTQNNKSGAQTDVGEVR